MVDYFRMEQSDVKMLMVGNTEQENLQRNDHSVGSSNKIVLQQRLQSKQRMRRKSSDFSKIKKPRKKTDKIKVAAVSNSEMFEIWSNLQHDNSYKTQDLG